jgi:hypothetical protein
MKMVRPKANAMRRIAVAILGLAIVAGCQPFGFGDPSIAVWVRNDSGEPKVVLLEDPERGTSDRYIAPGNAVGATVTGPGRFRGSIKVLNPRTCVIEAELPIEGGIFVVVIDNAGHVAQVSLDDAFPDPRNFPDDKFSATRLCGSSQPSPS